MKVPILWIAVYTIAALTVFTLPNGSVYTAVRVKEANNG